MTVQPRPAGAVFLSYASQDAEAAERICDALRAAGVEVWLDKSELRGGDAWDAKIKKHIHECALFIPVISAHTNARSEGYFRREWNLATRRLLDMANDAAFLVPVVIDQTRERDARVPEEFLHAQWTRLPNGETPPAFAQRLRQLLGTDAARGDSTQSAVDSSIESHVRVPYTRNRNTPTLRLVALAVIALLGLGAGALWYYYGARDPPAAREASTAAQPAAAAMPHEKSIAVLPFVDMSPGKDQEYMSDGMAEELLNLLAQVPELKVIARTSSFAFKDQNLEIAEIAKKLNVAHVLEGSVRTSGNQMRITAQLVRAADSTHLWSDRYDRPMDDIFAVQDEIANAIVQALRIKLAGGSLSRQEGDTQNLEAYQLWLRAVSANRENTRSSLNAAEELLERAIKLDPNYGKAWAQVAQTLVNKADNGFVDATEGYEGARKAAQRALQLSPELAEARAHLQYIYLNFDWDWVAAEAEGRRALAITKTDTRVLNSAGILAYTLGRWDDAERQLRAALVQDPLNTHAIWNLGFTYYGSGRFAESERMYRKLLEVEPGFGTGRNYLGLALLAQGRAAEALSVVQHQSDDGERLRLLPIFLQAVGRRAESDEALKAQIARWAKGGAFYIAMTYAYRGNYDQAIQWLERAYKQKDSWLGTITGEQLFKGMAGDPRYEAFLQKMKLPDPEAAT